MLWGIVLNFSKIIIDLRFVCCTTKGFFFRKCDSFFKSPKKKIFQITILNLKFKFPPITYVNFKLRMGIIFLEIWKFEKRISLSEKITPLWIALQLRFKNRYIYYVSTACISRLIVSCKNINNSFEDTYDLDMILLRIHIR